MSAVKSSQKVSPYISNNMKFLWMPLYITHVRSGDIHVIKTQPRALQPWAYRSCSTWKYREPEYLHTSGQAFNGRLCIGNLLARPDIKRDVQVTAMNVHNAQAKECRQTHTQTQHVL